MSDKDGAPKSWASTIVIGIIILVLAVGLIFFIYYIFLQTNINPFPISPFKFGDTIQISPAVFVRESFENTETDPNQYLVKNTCANFPCEDCYQPVGANVTSCVATFTGNKNDPDTKWVLEQLPFTGTEFSAQQADQNVLAFGNKFYLRNSTNSPTDVAGRLLFSLFDSTGLAPSCNGLSPDRSFPISTPFAGSTCYEPDTQENRGNELVVYFWPSTQPDLYYILLPGSLNNTGLRFAGNSVTSQLNNGVVTLRPYAPSEQFQTTYNPFNPVDDSINNNGPLLNSQGPYPVGEKYPAPEVFLFKVVKAS